MGLGKTIVMGFLVLSSACSLFLSGAYAFGYTSKRSGVSAAFVSLINATTSGLAFLALYLDW